ncbi:MAG: membrane protein insertion efficiency factor YidD [Saprospiraceae bacterium]
MLKYPLILLIRVYQYTLSPLLGANKCRYQPSCSQYTVEALQEWGLMKGLWMGILRIGRCHPWSNHPMHDPVPKRKPEA